MYFLIFQSEVILKLFLNFNESQPIQHMLINVLLIKKCISTKQRVLTLRAMVWKISDFITRFFFFIKLKLMKNNYVDTYVHIYITCVHIATKFNLKFIYLSLFKTILKRNEVRFSRFLLIL